MGWLSKPAKSNVRSRDGLERRTSSERRAARKASGLSARQQKKVIKGNRSYKKGW